MRLPNSIECEKSLLGCVILDNAILPRLSVTVDDFYDSKHRAVYQAMNKLHADGRPIEFTTLATELGNNESGASEIDFLVSLMDASSSAANFTHYAEIVQEKSRLRDLIALAANLHNKCIETPDKQTIIKLLYGVQTVLAELNPKDDKGSGMLSNLVKQQIELTKAIRNGEIVNNAVKTGFHDVDFHIDGLIPGNLIVVAGRPGTGKTAFALDVVLNLIKKGMAACYYSFEMTCAEITRRLISKQTGVGLKNLMNGLLGEDEIARLLKLTSDDFLGNLFITEKKMNYIHKAVCDGSEYRTSKTTPDSVWNKIIDLYNQHHLYEGNEKVQRDYDMWFGQNRRASACIACGQCEEKCPQSLPIIEIMKKASALFDGSQE